MLSGEEACALYVMDNQRIYDSEREFSLNECLRNASTLASEWALK